MPLVDLDPDLTDVERSVLDSAHKFAEEVMRPAGAALDRLSDPAEVIAPGSVLWRVFDKYAELGFDMLELPDPELSLLQQARLRLLIGEEMGWGDAGLAITLGVAGFHRFFARLSGSEELIERFAGPENREIGCWAITEPDHGSDMVAFDKGYYAKRAPNCIARLEGDEYVIQGQKAAWVSNGTIAKVATVFCAVDSGQGVEGGGVCLVPLDVAGVSRGQPLDKLGQRALNQGEIFFDGVRIPKSYMLFGPEAYEFVLEQVLTVANASMGITFVGLGRAALEHALTYAKERIQGGVPIFEHQSVKTRLFKAFMQVEAARSLARRVLVYNTTNPPQLQYSIASKVFCTNTAFEVASTAVQIYGGSGLSREYPVEKLLRDARASLIEDGCNDVLSLHGASKL
jgi:alkylation response protein AidB-like acyl-CoA dehydrogenase